MRGFAGKPCLASGLAGCLLLAAGCAGDRSSEPDPRGATTPPLEWLAPASGDSLADTIRVRIRTERVGLTTVRLEADGILVAESDDPPWDLRTLPDAEEARTIELSLHAEERDQPAWTSEPRTVHWRPNAPPVVRLHRPGDAIYLDRASGDSLWAEATDPEDGPIPGASIFWSSSVQGLVGSGARLPLAALTPGAHLVRVRAQDRWLRGAWDEAEITVFQYDGARSPHGALEDFRHAWNTRQAERASSLLASQYRFVFCEEDREADPTLPATWGRAEEAAWLAHALGSARIIGSRLSWTLAAPQEAWVDGAWWAKVEITELALQVDLADAAGLSILGGAARVYLAEETPGTWSICLWRDLGASSELTQGLLRGILSRLPG